MNLHILRIILISSIVLLNVFILGCANVEIPTKHPRNALIAVDNSEHVHIVYESGIGTEEHPNHIEYLQLDPNGKIQHTMSLEGNGQANIIIDSSNNIHIISENRIYNKIDGKGNLLIEGKEIKYPFNSSKEDIVFIDNKDLIHIITRSRIESNFINYEGEIWHIILDLYGNIIKQYCLIKSKESYLFDLKVVIDIDNNVYIIFCDLLHEGRNIDYIREQRIRGNVTKIHLLKQNSKGEIIINDTIVFESYNRLFIKNFVVDSYQNIHVFWSEYDQKSTSGDFYLFYYYDEKPLKTYWKKIKTNGTEDFIKNISPDNYFSLVIDIEDNIHILTGSYYSKYNNNGEIIIFDDIENISLFLEIPIIRGSNGKLLLLTDESYIDETYLHKRYLVDQFNNIHIISEEKTEDEDGLVYYSIYYSKFNSNGEIIKDQMLIDSDNELLNENDYVSINYNIIFIIIIIIIILLIYRIIKKRK